MRRAEVVKTFHEYNDLLFGGRLVEPDFLLRRLKLDFAVWHEPSGAYPAGLLVLATNKRHPWTWRATLLHEMVHISTPNDDAHGEEFTSECNRVGALIGLEPCDVSESWHWPCPPDDFVPNDSSVTAEWEQGD